MSKALHIRDTWLYEDGAYVGDMRPEQDGWWVASPSLRESYPSFALVKYPTRGKALKAMWDAAVEKYEVKQ